VKRYVRELLVFLVALLAVVAVISASALYDGLSEKRKSGAKTGKDRVQNRRAGILKFVRLNDLDRLPRKYHLKLIPGARGLIETYL
jgi:hypothetical protein